MRLIGKDYGDERYNRDLLALIPPGRRRVVDIGSAHGAFAKALRVRQPDVHVTGVDIDQEYARLSARYCHRVVVGDVEALAPSVFDALCPSDCWIFGDCLEHLLDPWRLVAAVRGRIDDDGCIVVCLPNAQHWSVQVRLASGHFFYEDEGLMDRTHLRWFTRRTMVDMFGRAGWKVDHLTWRGFSTEAPHGVIEGIQQVARAVGADPQEAAVEARVFQYLFRLVPGG